MYRYASLTPKAARAFAALTYERYRRPITDAARADGLIVVGAYSLLEPVGLLVGAISSENSDAHLLSLTVVSEHQSRGIATEMLRQFEEAVCARDGQVLYASYVGDNPPLERAFAKQGWDAPRVMAVAVECSPEAIYPSPIYQMKAVAPPEFEFFAWADLTATDRAAIEARERQLGGWYSAASHAGNVSPFVEEQFLEPQCSVGLRHQGEVVGWMIVHRIRADALHFISLFLSPEYRRQNLGILLVMSAVQRVVDTYLPVFPSIRVFWQFTIENNIMEQMVEQHLAPYALAFNREKTVIKHICYNV